MDDSTNSSTASHAAGHSGRGQRWRQRLAVAVVVVVLLVIFRAPLLRGLAGVLVADQPVPASSFFVLHDRNHRYDRAAALARVGTIGQVLLLDWVPDRLQMLGVKDEEATVSRRELAQRGVPEQRLEMIAGKVDSDWDVARALGRWLEQHPDATLVIATDRFNSRRIRLIVDRCLPPEHEARVHITALPHREYDETNWWQNKHGVLDWFNSTLRLLHVWAAGENRQLRSVWTPDELEAMVP